jgi:membrane-bound lytic murein transglycosylase D
LAIYVSNGKQYNLKIDSYIDERSDPLKATAAAKYMSNMYAILVIGN